MTTPDANAGILPPLVRLDVLEAADQLYLTHLTHLTPGQLLEAADLIHGFLIGTQAAPAPVTPARLGTLEAIDPKQLNAWSEPTGLEAAPATPAPPLFDPMRFGATP